MQTRTAYPKEAITATIIPNVAFLIRVKVIAFTVIHLGLDVQADEKHCATVALYTDKYVKAQMFANRPVVDLCTDSGAVVVPVVVATNSTGRVEFHRREGVSKPTVRSQGTERRQWNCL